jgi:hypothetical protein
MSPSLYSTEARANALSAAIGENVTADEHALIAQFVEIEAQKNAGRSPEDVVVLDPYLQALQRPILTGEELRRVQNVHGRLACMGEAMVIAGAVGLTLGTVGVIASAGLLAPPLAALAAVGAGGVGLAVGHSLAEGVCPADYDYPLYPIADIPD